MKFTLWMTALVAGLILVGCNGQTASAPVEENAATTQEAAGTTDEVKYNGQIVYVQLDSLMRGYGKAIDLQDEYSKKSEKIEKELTSKGRSLEREARDLQEKYNKGQLTSYQANEKGSELQKKEQNFNAYAQQKTGELMEEQEVIMNQISTAIMDYVKKYNTEKGYSMIISTTGANTVLAADPSLDITTELLKGLNDEYKKELEEKK